MNDEYLWNKTGTDAEIEALEKSLREFRFQPTKPPTLPARTDVLPVKRSFNFFRLGFAVAFAAAFVAVISVVWLMSPRPNHPVNRDSIARSADQPSNPPAIRPEVSATPIIDPPMPKPKVINFKPPTTNATRAVKVIAKREEKLTPEEKHAYDQLMLAIAITSNELKIVKDKINGRDEERTAARDRQK